MSELTNKHRDGRDLRRHLFGTVSAIALIASASAATASDDESRPTIWVELGGNVERADSSQAVFSPQFFTTSDSAILSPMLDAQREPKYSIGGESKISFMPQASDWVFSAAVRYGRSNGQTHKHYESDHPIVPFTISGSVVGGPNLFLDKFGDGQSQLRESHALLDFQAGREVGLGMFGAHGSSAFSAGIRIAQFTEGANVTLHARPVYGSYDFRGIPGTHSFHNHFWKTDIATLQSKRSTQGVGPSLAWDASAVVAGNDPGMVVAMDWGVNAAVLFGRQRAYVHHKTVSSYYKGFFSATKVSGYTNSPPDQNRARTVTIPNIGGFAGVSFRYSNAKISFGYRGDFFFGAMDGGIDTAKRENVGFYGPFASVSVGIGG